MGTRRGRTGRGVLAAHPIPALPRRGDGFEPGVSFAPELPTRMTVGGVANFPSTDADRALVERGNALDLLPSMADRVSGAGTP
jgi:hypothetical protein